VHVQFRVRIGGFALGLVHLSIHIRLNILLNPVQDFRFRGVLTRGCVLWWVSTRGFVLGDFDRRGFVRGVCPTFVTDVELSDTLTPLADQINSFHFIIYELILSCL